MKALSHSVDFGKERIEFSIVRQDRTTLEIAVEPDARVVVAAPRMASLEAIKEKVRKRAAWIRRQQRYFHQFLPRTPDRKYVSGETHLYLGRQYRLKVVPHVQAAVKLYRGFIMVQTHQPHRPEVTRELLESWYRLKAQIKFSERIETNILRFSRPERFRPQAVIVRQMRQRWGSMSPASRLLLNLRLVEAPVDAIDYVITHELCRIVVPHHGPAFFKLLGQVLPDWQSRKHRLEQKMS